MPRRALNGLIGFCVGSAAYYLFLCGAAVVGSQGWRSDPYSFRIRFLRSGSVLFSLVSKAELSHRMQPHYLYLCALICALIFCRSNRPFREDLPLYTHRFAAVSWSFFGAVVLNLWFSVSNILPGRFGL